MSLIKLIQKITTGKAKPRSFLQDESNKTVGITKDIYRVSVMHNGERIVIKRNQDVHAHIPELFQKTSRPCPPFCIQPMQVSPQVETIGELEMLSYLKEAEDGNVVVVDSRIKKWLDKGTIPGSIHIPWTELVSNEGATSEDKLGVLQNHLGIKWKKGKTIADLNQVLQNNARQDTIEQDETEQNTQQNKQIAKLLDFSNAKTVVLYCNGSWCGQTSESIKALIQLGYPEEKIKYYRNGMQGWVTLGLTTVYANQVSRISRTEAVA